MQKQIFKDELTPVSEKRKKELDGTVEKLRKWNDNPRFRKFVKELRAYHTRSEE